MAARVRHRILSALPFTLKSALIASRPHEVRRTWLVSRTMSLPELPGVSRRHVLGPVGRALGYLGKPQHRTNEVWAISMVRDEADIIGYTIEHLLAEGVDRVLIADNGSTDGTRDVLEDFALHHPVVVVDDYLRAYHQGVKMTRLARYAAAAGAGWIIPFDADELWYSPDGRPLADTLRYAECDVAIARIWNHFPAPDDPDDPNPYLRLKNRTRDPLPRVHVAFRAHPWARLVPGNHNVRHPGRRATVLGVRNLPARTPEQIARKYPNGREALEASDLPANFGAHWRELGALPIDELLARVRSDTEATVVDRAPFRSLATAAEASE